MQPAHLGPAHLCARVAAEVRSPCTALISNCFRTHTRTHAHMKHMCAHTHMRAHMHTHARKRAWHHLCRALAPVVEGTGRPGPARPHACTHNAHARACTHTHTYTHAQARRATSLWSARTCCGRHRTPWTCSPEGRPRRQTSQRGERGEVGRRASCSLN